MIHHSDSPLTSLTRRPVHAPVQHGATFCDPPWEQLPECLTTNVARRRQWGFQIGGTSASHLIESARQEFIRLAGDYTRQYRDVRATQPMSPLIVSGHQPRLFHPGVWYKNAALSRLAVEQGGVGINLIVDNDTIGTAAIRVPTGTVVAPHGETVAYDRPTEDIPFEERTVLDRDLFESFGRRVVDTLRPFVHHSLIATWWPRVVEAAAVDSNLGGCVARARHQLEEEWALQTLELPLSRVCATESFRQFAWHLLVELPRLHAIYNAELHAFRRVERIRSRAHPVPDLERDGEWLEAPLWIWSSDAPLRRRVFARQRRGELELTDRAQRGWTVPMASHNFLADAEARGIRIRPRALVTTMFARLILSDLFLHGIGGGHYDQLTDAIVRRFFGVEPPTFVVLTATARLPIPRPAVSPADLRGIDQTLRELTFHPERFLSSAPSAADMVAEKLRCLTLARSANRHQAIVAANGNLQPFVSDRRSRLLLARVQVAEQLRAESVLGSREWAFCLFPEATLRELLVPDRYQV